MSQAPAGSGSAVLHASAQPRSTRELYGSRIAAHFLREMSDPRRPERRHTQKLRQPTGYEQWFGRAREWAEYVSPRAQTIDAEALGGTTCSRLAVLRHVGHRHAVVVATVMLGENRVRG